MRTIKKSLQNRMRAQADEAKTLGLEKVATNLDTQIEAPIRESDEFYFYTEADFKADVEKSFWNAAIRTADFYDGSFDAQEVQGLVEAASEEFVKGLRHKMGVRHGVGAYEPTVPGETLGRMTIEVTEE